MCSCKGIFEDSNLGPGSLTLDCKDVGYMYGKAKKAEKKVSWWEQEKYKKLQKKFQRRARKLRRR